MIVENACFHFCFWVIFRCSSYVGNCTNIFPLKVHSISSDFVWSFLILDISQIRWKKNFTFSNAFFEKCAQKLVWYLSETLPAATCFNPEPMGFLIELSFRKGFKIVTRLSKNWKIRKVWHLCVNWKNFIVLFSTNCVLVNLLFQRSVKWNFYSRKLCGLDKNLDWFVKKRAFCRLLDLRPIPKTLQIHFQKCPLDTGISHYWVF